MFCSDGSIYWMSHNTRGSNGKAFTPSHVSFVRFWTQKFLKDPALSQAFPLPFELLIVYMVIKGEIFRFWPSGRSALLLLSGRRTVIITSLASNSWEEGLMYGAMFGLYLVSLQIWRVYFPEFFKKKVLDC